MSSFIYPLLFLLFTNLFLEPTTTSSVTTYIQSLELDDITSLWDKFPAIVGQIKQAVNRFRCPKGWRRLGGSCYYLSNITSIPSDANETCSQLHSNQSNLMQIRHAYELFYAAHILTKNNLSALMIEIEPNLLKGKTMTELLMDDEGRWQRMKEKFREVRQRYYKLKRKILNELNEAGLRISRRSRKIKQSVQRRKQTFIADHIDSNEMYEDYYDHSLSNQTIIYANDTKDIEEYEYDDLDSDDQTEDFEPIDDIRGICDQIDWNVLNNNVTVYMLTTYLIEDKIICSLSNIEDDQEYNHICEYVLDFCFANIVCGKHGRCVNTLSGFKCSCSFLYGGILCERISRQGKQIIIGIVLVVLLYALSFKPIRWLLIGMIRSSNLIWKQFRQKKEQKNNDKEELFMKKKRDDDEDQGEEDKDDEEEEDQDQENVSIQIERRQTLGQELMEFIQEIIRCIPLPRSHQPLANPNKRDLVRVSWVGGLTVFYLTLLLSITTITHFTSFKYDIVNETRLEALINETVQLVAKCGNISNYRVENLVFFPISFALIILFSWSIKREKRCPHLCDGRPGLIAPIEPFRTANRFTTATVFGILSFEVLKIFEELLFSTADPFSRGILIELLERIAMVVMIGLRYYPVLASLQLRNITVRFFVCLYIIGDMIYTIIREGSCMGFLPLSRYYSALEEATLRMEIGTWFIIYGLIKNTPHFILLSYICAELCVRFAYDSIYVPVKKGLSIWSSPVAQPDEAAFAKYYVKKLFQRNVRATTRVYSTKVDVNKMDDYQYEEELQRRAARSRVRKFFSSIYQWDDDFRFTTMATCTYTVAIVFLYYLACTLVFLYISRTTGHISFIRNYIEQTFNIEFHGFFSLRSTIIISAVIAVGIFAFQLFLGMQNYKRHKLQLFKGIYEDVPSASNFNLSSIASKSVHYSGFLVGYMAWGFIICFHLIFFILSAIRIIALQIRYFELLLAVTVPVLVVYLLKMVSTSSVGKFFFIQDRKAKLNLSNRKFYAIFLYFNFFADCFLGIASCIIRLIKATMLNVVYMARLDCSFLGRPIERFDLGFAAYVSYLHMEVTHTNPIMLAFCYSLYDDVVQRRPKRCYDDECCIAPGELEDNETPVEPKLKPTQRLPSKTSDHSANGSIGKKTKVIPVVKRQKSIDKDDDDDDDDNDDDDGQQVHEIVEVKPKKKSSISSSTSDKNSAKSKRKKLSIDDQLDEEIDDDGGPTTPSFSTVARLIPFEQPRLPPPSAPIPDAPPRQDLPPIDKHKNDDDDDDDDDGGVRPPSFSTIARIIPQKAPRLLPMQQTLPPSVPRRKDRVNDDDDNDDEDDDGGIKFSKTIQHKQKPMKDKRRKGKQEVSDDDGDDDDGGLPVSSISTISKAIPQQAPRMLPVQRFTPVPASSSISVQRLSSPVRFQTAPRSMLLQHSMAPPPPPIRQDLAAAIAADDDEDDGGINPKVIAKRKEELAKKKKKKEELKKKKQLSDAEEMNDDGGVSHSKSTINKKKVKKSESKIPMILDNEDEDGGIGREQRLAAEKKKKELEAKRKKQEEIKAKIRKENDEDDDGGLGREERLAAEKKKKELEAKKKKQHETKAKIKQNDDDEDDDGAVKRHDSHPKKKPSKKSSKPEISNDTDEDDDGGRIPKTYDTIKVLMPSKRPVLHHDQHQKSPSPEVDDDGGMSTTKHSQEPLLKSYDTVGRIVANISLDNRKTKEDNHYDVIPTDEERAARSRTTYSPPTYDQTADSHDVTLVRTNSYREATDNTIPVTQRQRKSGSIRSHSKSNEDSSHYSEITDKTTKPSGIINRSYSNTGSIQSTSNHSIKQQSKQSSEHTLKEDQQTEETSVESEGQEEDDDEEEEEEEDDDDEEEVEEQKKMVDKERSQPKKLTQQKPKGQSSMSTAFPTLTHLVDPEKAEEIQKLIRQKQARFRWFLAYTIINNYHLFDLRKEVQSRLARLRIERSNLIDEQQHAATAVTPAAAPMIVLSESPDIRSRKLRAGPMSPTVSRLLSIPVPIVDDYPQSPAERYVAIRSSMLYDVTAQQADTPRSPMISQVPSTASHQVRLQTRKNLVAPTLVVRPPSDSNTTSKNKRPEFQRQETVDSDPLILNLAAGTPVFQALPESTYSTADYPFTANSSVTNSSILRTQMSHAQHMQAWQQRQLRKLQKKRPHCYHYGAPLQRPLEEKVATAAILTPTVISSGDKLRRLPSSSPFQYPRQIKTIGEKSTKNRSKSSNPSAASMSTNTEGSKQGQTIKKKPLRITSSSVHRKDSQNSFSNVTEV